MNLQQMTQLTQEVEQARTNVRTMVARFGDDPGPAGRAEIQQAVDKTNALRARLDRLHIDAAQSAEIARLTSGLGFNGDGSGQTSHGGGGRSLGAQIIASEAGQYLIKHRGAFPTGAWTSPSAELMATTLDESGGSGGSLVLPDYRPGIQPLPTRRLVMADLIAPGTTTSNSVGYMKESSIVNAAAMVLEGAAKPESAIVFTAVTDPVRKIATWLPVTDEMLEDVPAAEAYIDTRLRQFVQLAEDDQLLNGNGTAPNITGILHRAGLAASIARVAETNPDVILKQISAIELATSLEVDGIVLNPAQWDNLLLLKDTDGNYIAGGGPFALPGRKVLWGRNVAVTPAIAAGTALIGAFATASQFFRRGGLRVEASNSHSDFFVKNLIAIRAEERGALCVYREAAFGTVTNLV